jgi:predicted XRE-type DNA-binding protein
MSEPIIESSGNVFLDMGFPPAEAAILQMRAKLMTDLQAFIKSGGMTQVQVAERLGITQSRVSDLMRGKWDKFSLEMLITLEARAGRELTLEFTT